MSNLMVDVSENKREPKRLNLSVIIIGVVLMLIGQTWLSVLTAQQAYSMNEARVNEARIDRVSERLEELVNFFRSPELIYYYASKEGYSIVLTADENDDIKIWGHSTELEVEERYAEATNFVENIEPLLPQRNIVYFVPFRETVKGTMVGSFLDFIENIIGFVSQTHSEGFNVTWDSLRKAEPVEDVSENFEAQQIIEAEIIEELLEETNKGLLPSPDTH